MTLDLAAPVRPPYALLALILAQAVCAVVFVGDVMADSRMEGTDGLHLSIELVAAVTLAVTIAFETRYVMRLLRRQAHLRRAASLAAAAMTEVIDAHFEAWKLTPSENDVATLLVKGLPIAEIARIRGSAEGTVKSHLNAIYRKSGSQNRGELLAQIIDSMMDRGSGAERRAGTKTTG